MEKWYHLRPDSPVKSRGGRAPLLTLSQGFRRARDLLVDGAGLRAAAEVGAAPELDDDAAAAFRGGQPGDLPPFLVGLLADPGAIAHADRDVARDELQRFTVAGDPQQRLAGNSRQSRLERHEEPRHLRFDARAVQRARLGV